jgi:site-specific recombinase XerD
VPTATPTRTAVGVAIEVEDKLLQIRDALGAYVRQLRADGRSKHTIDQARRHVNLLIAATGDIEIERVRHEDVASFLASDAVRRRADGAARKPASGNAIRSSLRCFFGFVHAAAYAPGNAARLVRRARCNPPRPRALSESDTGKLLAALEAAKTGAERRDRVLFITMLRTGLRVGSVVSLDVEDVDLAAGELRIRTLKNGGTDTVFMPEQVIEILRAHIGDRTDGPLFRAAAGHRLGGRQVHRRLEEWARRAGVAGLSPHGLRHTFAMAVYERTRDVLVTARALCHRSVASTAVYARPAEAAVRAAVGCNALP